MNHSIILRTMVLWICLNYSFSFYANSQDLKLSGLHEIGKNFSTYIKNNDGWKRESWGELKDLIFLKKTNTFGEQAFKLKVGASILGLSFDDQSRSYRSIHLIEGILKISVSTTKENIAGTQIETLRMGDVLILSPGASLVHLENGSNSQSQFDYTFSFPIIPKLSTAADYKIKHPRDQQEIRFKVNLEGPVQIAKTLVNGDEVSQAFSRVEFVIGKKERGPSFHTHATFETFRIPHNSPGSLEVSIGGDGKREIKLMSGDIANISPEVSHSYRNLSAEHEVKLIATFAPAGLEKMFIGFHETYRQYLADRKRTKNEAEILELNRSYPTKLNAVRQIQFNHIDGLRSPAKGAWKVSSP